MGTTAVPRCPHSFLSRIDPPEIHFTGSIPALLPAIGHSRIYIGSRQIHLGHLPEISPQITFRHTVDGKGMGSQ